jgi:hypothetical protein
MFKLDIKQLNALAKLADELLLDGNRKEELVDLLKVHIETDLSLIMILIEVIFIIY